MNILHEIVERNRPLLAERKARVSLAALEAGLKNVPARPGFAAAFAGAGVHVIAELKSASPSRGVIREPLAVKELAGSLAAAGAAALSVLTEPLYFHGSLENLQLAASAVPLPLLRKDFIVDPYQIAEAKACGASAVLLIAALLDKAAFAELANYAHALGLDVLGEVHTEAEIETVAPADLIGVNARDLRDFSTSLERSAALIATLHTEKPVIAESAVRTGEEMRRLRAAGASGFLIGETLMRAPDPGEKLKELLSCC